MENEKNCQASTDTDNVRHEYGSYLLVGYPQGEPTAFVVRDDADPLWQALQGAFGRPTAEAVNGNGNGNGIVVAGHGVLRTKQAQP